MLEQMEKQIELKTQELEAIRRSNRARPPEFYKPFDKSKDRHKEVEKFVQMCSEVSDFQKQEPVKLLEHSLNKSSSFVCLSTKKVNESIDDSVLNNELIVVHPQDRKRLGLDVSCKPVKLPTVKSTKSISPLKSPRPKEPSPERISPSELQQTLSYMVD
jgi:hypothetical protein